MTNLWYHNAIMYSLDVETFMDASGDGVGDFEGLISRLDYLAGLGVNCLWLRPFYPSPLVDDGYDVMDYYDVDHRFGTLGDFVDFIKKAEALGMRVIIDLVANHTSNKHPWFLESRKNPGSRFRNYYVWSDEPDEEYKQKNILGEEGIWEYDRVAKSYYLHHFYKEQPDLNLANPDVRNALKKIMGFWLQLGVSGFRIDAAHIMIKEVGNRKVKDDEVLHILDELREFLNSRSHQAILLAEANVPVYELKDFFKGGGRMHLLFNFISNKNLFLSLARDNPKPLVNALSKLKNVNGHWVNFLRHHDELNLEMLEEDERDEVFEAFAPENSMRIFGHGIRRRLPPMLNNNRQKLELVYSVMFGLPGVPLINYGEEIAMGDDLNQRGRNSVRTVMQWDDTRNAGFSKARKIKLEHTVIDYGEYDYRKVNVALQQKEPDSFFNWISRLVVARKQCPQLAYGNWEFIDTKNDCVLGMACRWQKDVILTFHNFSKKDQKISPVFDDNMDDFVEIFSNNKGNKLDRLAAKMTIEGYGYRWFKCD